MTISVALCTYNGEKFLRKQLDSILDQTVSVNEIVVCDDGSTDATLKILNEYGKSYPHIFKIHNNEKNLRSVKNFEKAISLCQNDIIFLSDQDDVWVKEKVEKYTSFFRENPKTNAICSNGFGIDQKDVILDVVTVWDIIAEQKKRNPKLSYFETINFAGNFVTGASMAIRKDFVSKCTPFPEINGFHHDEWIALIAGYTDSLEFFPDKLFFYRQHDDQQVGGVFFENTENKKRRLFKFFTVDDHQNKSFGNYKHLLKRLSASYKKNQQLIETSVFYRNLLGKNLEKIEVLFYIYKNRMKNKYPVRFFFLNIIDKIKNKRQLGK